ncbi:MAG: chromosomal replication initiator protein DnaA [Treponemataceae bacterium]|nr:MAG: chromosomal replication initiator protein DnaA [Treponemataceae bacterium]
MADKDYLSLFKDALTQIAIEFENEQNITEFDSWLRDIEYISATDDTITVSVLSKFIIDQIKKRGHLDLLQEKLTEISGQKFDIIFTVCDMAKKTRSGGMPSAAKKDEKDGKNPAAASSDKNSGKSDRIAQSLQVQPVKKEKHPQLQTEYRFETFVPGENNEFAFNVAVAISKNPGNSSYNPILLVGGTGLGKTHLMQSIGNYIYENSTKKIVYVTAENFTNEFTQSISKRTTDKFAMENFKQKYRKADVLLMDDIHFLSSKGGTQEELFHTFEALYQNNKQLVFTCDRPVSELKDFTARLKSRFEHGIPVEMLIPNYETRKAILLKKVELMQKNVPDDVIDLIAKNVETNVRVLEGALNQIIAYAELTDKKISVDIARDKLRNIFHNPKTFPIETIQRIVADYFNISFNDIKSAKRQQPISHARNIAIYIASQLTENTLSSIGDEFGGRDHATVIHSKQKIETDIKLDSNLDAIVQMLMRQIQDKK